MAKKIKIDFSKTEERSGWNTRQVPAGLYRAQVAAVTETEASDGTAMLVYAFVPEDTQYRSRRFPYYCKLQQNQLWKLRDLLVAAGVSVPKKAVSINPEAIVGKDIVIEVEDDSYNGTVRSAVVGTYAASILEDSEDTSEEEEGEDFEEYDEELEEDDELEDEDLEDFDDDEDEEDFDEEDFDDDEEEEEEEEEEESEPAPKKRVVRKRPTRRKK